MNREYDLIIYGASGFTGRLAVEYLDENYSDLNWAIAGRNEDKLVNISKNSKCKPDYFIADSNDCLLYTSPSPRDSNLSRMPSSA